MISEAMRKIIENVSAVPVEPKAVFAEVEAKMARSCGAIRNQPSEELGAFYGTQVIVLKDFDDERGAK